MIIYLLKKIQSYRVSHGFNVLVGTLLSLFKFAILLMLPSRKIWTSYYICFQLWSLHKIILVAIQINFCQTMQYICEIWRKKQMYFGIAIQVFIHSLIGWRRNLDSRVNKWMFVLLDSVRLLGKSKRSKLGTHSWWVNCLLETMSHLTCPLQCCKCN